MTRRKLPVSKYLTPCPDCNATYRGNKLLHELSCPMMGAVELVCEQDARYFEANPDQSTYVRPVTRAELEQLRHTDPPTARAATHVVVDDCRLGRMRTFVDQDAEPLGLMIDFRNEGAA